MPTPASVSELLLVEVTWQDAAISPSAGSSFTESPEDQAKFGGSLLCRDVGYLIRWDSRDIVLAVNCIDEQNEYRHSNTIPRRMVRKVEILSRSNQCLTSNPYGKTATPKTPRRG